MRIRVDRLRHTYAGAGLEERTVLAIDAWEAGPGSQWLLHGVSGSGKTTLLNVLAGLLPPSAGSVTIGDETLYALPEATRDRWRATRIGYVYQAHLLVPILDALENVELALRFGEHLSRRERRARARELLARVGLARLEGHRPSQLSMGQRQRVAVARALVIEPEVVLADEPTAALDPATADVVLGLLLEYSATRTATLLVASHDPALDERFADRMSLVDGRLQDVATAAP